MDIDLTPRTSADDGGRPLRRRRRRSPLAVALLVLLLGALSFVVFRGLTNATLYFYNADEAVERRDELGDRRFRLQGEVQDDVVETDVGARFTVAFNGVERASSTTPATRPTCSGPASRSCSRAGGTARCSPATACW